MNRNEYMAALRRALSVLPEEERASALRYYEEYFDDAGPENEQEVISDLGAPEKVAEQILADYRELTAVPRQNAGGTAEKKTSAAGAVFPRGFWSCWYCLRSRSASRCLAGWRSARPARCSASLSRLPQRCSLLSW